MNEIGPYRVVEELPRGNTGRVFLVQSADSSAPASSDHFVLKTIDPEHLAQPLYVEMLRREAPAAQRFVHPYAVRTRGVEATGSRAVIARELVEGMPLAALLDRQRVRRALLPWEFAVTLGVQIARVIAAAHETAWAGRTAGLLHGHLSCGGVYVTYTGYAKVLGFGFGRSRTCLPPGHATLPYRAPELLEQEKMTEATDVYGLGAILHAALLGYPERGRACVSETTAAILNGRPSSVRIHRPEVPAVLDELVQRLLARDPRARPASLLEVEARLRDVLPEPDAFYAEGLSQTMAIYFPEHAAASRDRRQQAGLRRRVGAVEPVRKWPARPSRPPPDEFARGRVISEVRHRIRVPETPARGVTLPVAGGAWADEVRPSLEGLEEDRPFDVDTVVDAIVEATEDSASGPWPLPSTPPADPVLPSPRLTSGFTSEVTPSAVESTSDLLSSADRGLERGAIVGGRYRIVDVIGQGASSVVYRAEHLALNTHVAVKVLRPELCEVEAANARFSQGARAVSVLDHPNIVRVTDLGRTDNGSLFLVMDLVPGDVLSDLLRARGTLGPRDSVAVAQEMLQGLDHAHRLGMVHRELEPAKVMVALAPERVQAKLLDFGMARPEETLRATPAPETAWYMAPEQAQGEPVDARTDVYGVGVCLYEMLSGARAFSGASRLDVLGQVVMRTPPPPEFPETPEVDVPRLRDAVQRAMAKRPAERWSSAAQMHAALEGCLR